MKRLRMLGFATVVLLAAARNSQRTIVAALNPPTQFHSRLGTSAHRRYRHGAP